MKLLERHNIIDLVGKDRRKYHSAFITCYSYNFTFFEERVLPALRAANIKNVNIFTDGRCLDLTLEHTTGKEFRINKTYSLTPVYMGGAFHPKLMILLGVRQGLLVVGSGNLTGSGICSNDEIWGAFHLSLGEISHAGLFSEAWRYMLSLKKHTRGFVTHAYDWIDKYSPWVHSLPSESTVWHKISNQQDVFFLSNDSGGSIFKKIKDLIPPNTLESITIISPFYDSDGKAISLLNETFKPKTIMSIVQPELGSFPDKLDVTKLNIRFFKWENVIQDAARLHAKIFHFKYQDNLEYLLVGSANASIAALGSISLPASNDEVCLLLRRTSPKTYLRELGINLPVTGISLNEIQSINELSNISEFSPKLRIRYAEIEGKKITLHFDRTYSGSLILSLQDVDNLEIERIGIESKGTEITIEIEHINEAFKVSIWTGKSRISNYQLIHRVAFLIKNNPDPQHERLEALMEDILSGTNDSVTGLLNYLSYNWADDDEDHISKRGVTVKEKKDIQDPNTNYEKLKEEEFNRISKEILLKQAGILNSSNIRIAEFLSAISKNLKLAEREDYSESEESRQLLEGGGGEGGAVRDNKKKKSTGEREKKAIMNFFWSLYNCHNEMLKEFYKRDGAYNLEKPVTIKALSNMLIGIEVFNLYFGKKYIVEGHDENNQSLKKEFAFIPEGNITQAENSIWFLVDVLGKFLLLSVAGHKKYDYELLEVKQKELLWNLFAKSIFSISNATWVNNLYSYRDTLLLNLLLLINPNDVNESEFKKKLQQSLSVSKEKAQTINLFYKQNVDYFFNTVLPMYQKWYVVYSDDTKKGSLIIPITDLKEDRIVYKKSIGFAVFRSLSKDTGVNYLSLLGSGFEWYEEDEECMLGKHPNGNKIVSFN